MSAYQHVGYLNEGNVLVHMLALNDGSTALRVLGIVDDALVPQLRLLGLESALGLSVVAVVELAVDDTADIVLVLLREDLAVVDGLDLTVVVVLVDLLVNGGGDLLMPGGLDGLVLDCGSDLLVDGGVMVASLAHEVLDCLLGLIHFDVVLGGSDLKCWGLIELSDVTWERDEMV